LTHLPTNRRLTRTVAAASIRTLPAFTIATAIRRNSACVAGANLRKFQSCSQAAEKCYLFDLRVSNKRDV
jgi:hypothetical protein